MRGSSKVKIKIYQYWTRKYAVPPKWWMALLTFMQNDPDTYYYWNRDEHIFVYLIAFIMWVRWSESQKTLFYVVLGNIKIILISFLLETPIATCLSALLPSCKNWVIAKMCGEERKLHSFYLLRAQTCLPCHWGTRENSRFPVWVWHIQEQMTITMSYCL